METFSKILNDEKTVLVDFFAEWCGPCKMMAPVVEELAGEYEGKFKIGKLNVDEEPNTAEKYRVMSIPTMLVIKDGQPVDTIVGAVPKKKLQDKLDENI